MAYKLFPTNTDASGFRLDYMEVYNWGTFHDKVWKINPKGNTTLLTGSNGSGKSTFIDALLTLIVPFKKDRFYNQSSGEGKKGARSEKSYVLGNYGSKQDEGELSETDLTLRDDSAISILLASFKNEDNKYCTIFQCRWFSNGDLRSQFGLAHKQITIEEDFFPFDTKRKWKDNLIARHPDIGRGNQIEFFTGPGEYGERITRLFGMRSNRALSLFNQVVGIKYVEDLDLFFRNFMLEDKEDSSKSEYRELNNSFNELTTARNDIDKAEEQINQLQPISDNALKLKELTSQLKDLKIAQETTVYWFAEKGRVLSELEYKRLSKIIDILESEIDIAKNLLKELRTKEGDLKADIAQSVPGRQVEALKKEVDDLIVKRDQRTENRANYNELAKALDFKENPTKKVFDSQVSSAETDRKECERKEAIILEERRIEKNAKENSRKEIDDTKETINSLIKNKNNIPKNVSRIRDLIIAEVGATKKEIPFVGELIKVNDDSLGWENSIERLLHSFALNVVVPEKYYKAVNKYVNSTDLKGKIFYNKYVPTDTLLDVLDQEDEKSVYNKIDFKPDSQYSTWLKEQIINQFNFYCASDLSDFENSKKAITKEGLIKYGGGRHKKDDSRNYNNRSNYVLGWDNQNKVKLLREKVEELNKVESAALEKIDNLDDTLSENKTKRDQYFNFTNLFKKFDDINWELYVETIQSKKDKIDEINSSNDILKTLQNQLTKIEEAILDEEDKQDDRKATKTNNKTLKSKAKERQEANEKLLANFEENDIDSRKFEESYPQILDSTYESIDAIQSNLQKEIITGFKNVEEKKNRCTNDSLELMRNFISPNPDIDLKYPTWRSDANGLAAKIDLIDGYVEFYEDLIEVNLPKFKTNFDDLIQQTVLQNVEKFKQFFDTWKTQIEETIGALNKSLEEIVFKTIPSETYLQLKADYKTTKIIEEFKLLLKNATPNFREYDTLESKKIHFDNHINPLIERLKDEKWRESVMDVRRWYSYKTSEHFKSSKKQTNTVSSMARLSGGEKASLTYTVLGSAIAYQFGLTSNNFNNNSFRFIAIDEAFKGQDPDHADFLMKLCKQLKLQLLVVTPSDKMKIVQPYISYIHLIERQDEKDSVIRNMSIHTYEEGEKEYKSI